MLSSTVRKSLALLVGVDSFSTPEEVYRGLMRMVCRTGLTAYPNAFRPDRARDIVRNWIGGDPNLLSLSKCLNSWRADGGASLTTYAIGSIKQFSLNSWRAYSMRDTRTISTSDHSDRGGVSVGQGQDRLLADHGNAYVRPDNSTEFGESMDKVTRRLAASRGGSRLVIIWKLRLARVPNREIAHTLGVSDAKVSQLWEGRIRPIVREEFPELVNANR